MKIELIKNYLAHQIAWHLPRRIMYQAIIKAFAIATTGKNSHKHPDEVGFNDVLEYYK